MFVRFRERGDRLLVSVVETRRLGGRVRHEHITGLGSIALPLTVADRLAFWARLHERLAKLGNRVDAEAQGKILGSIHARIPLVTADEQRALQLANAQAEERLWAGLADMHEGTAAGRQGLIATAELAQANAAAQGAKAAERAAAARERMARLERGEEVAGGLGQPMTYEDFEEALLRAGMTKADIAHCVQTYEVSEAFGFDAMMKALLDAQDRAERRALRALHRRIPEEDGEG